MSDSRQEMFEKWLRSQSNYSFDLHNVRAASSDASFRRYYRLTDTRTGRDFIVMDAPPDKEDVRPFVAVAHLLEQAEVRVPHVLVKNETDGFLLLDDFGRTTMLAALCRQEKPCSADAMYRQAMTDLLHMQVHTPTDGLPAYSEQKLREEMDLFETWYVGKHCSTVLTEKEQNWLNTIKTTLVQSACAQAQVFVHRDYHSRNLMLIQCEQEQPTLGILDFQDAVKGPLSYDLVSVLRDAYIEWPEDQTVDWAIRYWEQARQAGLGVPADPSDFYRQFDYMGLQRHLKILGIFARLFHRDGKRDYVNSVPLVLAYVRSVATRYIAFKPLLLILDRLEGKAADVTYSF